MLDENNREEFTGQLIDAVENWLSEKGIDIPNEEKVRDNIIDDVKIYGSDYDCLHDEFVEILKRWAILKDK